ncbi:MAG TPA: oligosaccharide flippase family protein, partial [Steroidobacteraceae bacterium]|nr:oligosaccharide flippase family protein [Steroidobacteraceae bacterium]
MNLHDKLVSGLRSYASLRLLTQIASWLGTVYVVRHVDSHALGRYGVALVVFNYLSMTYDGTLIEALVQRPPASDGERRAVFTLVTAIGLVLAGATAAASPAMARLVDDAAVGPLVVGVALALALTSFCVLPHAALAREMDFRRLARIGAVQAICVTASTVALASQGAGAWALVGGQIVGTAVRAALLNAARRGFVLPTIHLAAAFGTLRFGGLLFVDNMLWRWYTSLDTILLGRWSGTAQLGYYSLAQQVAELPLEKISTVVNDVSLPAYAELREDRGAAAKLLLETIRTHAIAGFPIFWGLAAVAPYAVPVLFGNRWAAAVFPLIALAAIAPLRLIGSIETPAMTGLGRPGVLVRTKLIVAPAMTAALLVGCRLGGIDGAALAWFVTFPVFYAFAFRFVLRAAGLSYREVRAVARGPIAAAALMVAAVLVWSRIASLLGSAPVLALLTAIGVGVLAYAAGLRLIDPGAFRVAGE